MVDTFFQRAAALMAVVNWSQPLDISQKTKPILREIAETPGILDKLLSGLKTNKDYLAMCEREQSIERYILHDNPEMGFRLRMHVMTPGVEHIPHSHRRSFSSFILSGSYEHILFDQQDDGETQIDLKALEPRVVHTLRPGDCYAIDHRVIHIVDIIDSPCISLVIRGPAMKDSAWEADLLTGAEWQHRTTSATADVSRVTTLEKLGSADVERVHRLLKSRMLS